MKCLILPFKDPFPGGWSRGIMLTKTVKQKEDKYRIQQTFKETSHVGLHTRNSNLKEKNDVKKFYWRSKPEINN